MRIDLGLVVGMPTGPRPLFAYGYPNQDTPRLHIVNANQGMNGSGIRFESGSVDQIGIR
jgi:hypothetical protein